MAAGTGRLDMIKAIFMMVIAAVQGFALCSFLDA